jgi:hypothetical protein
MTPLKHFIKMLIAWIAQHHYVARFLQFIQEILHNDPDLVVPVARNYADSYLVA